MKYIEPSEVLGINITREPVCRSVSGYGCKMPTRYMIHIGPRWYRVYCVCFSNAGSLYIVRNGVWNFATLIEHMLEDARDEHHRQLDATIGVY